MKRATAWLVLCLAAAVGACGTKPTPTVSGLVISGTAALANKNDTTQLTAIANLSDGTSQNVTTTAVWSTSNAGIASVSSSGLVTATGNGSATVTATYQGRSGNLVIVVTLQAKPTLDALFTRLCSPFRAHIDVTISETSGNGGMNINSLTITMKDISGVAQVVHTFTPAELASLLGSNHINAGASKILSYESAYPGNVDTMDSTAVVQMSVTDDFGNTSTVTFNATFQRDRC